MAQLTTQQKVQTCLDFIDEQFDNESEQTILIAEMIIEDIKTLTQAYPDALRSGDIKQHLERVRLTQMNWVNQLQNIILEQSSRELNHQVLDSLKHFIDNLNQQTIEQTKFELPCDLMFKSEGRIDDTLDLLERQEVDLLLGQQSLFDPVIRH
ncbi:hypothetical protein QCB45_01840 [Thiomicrorhabdus sp. ZW0627]|nr:hypothetical protein [Thiomicrorhabdus sp. ZW0627]